MDAERLWDEYNKLPAEAQHQVVDFLALLRLRHAGKARRTAPQRIDWEHAPLVGMWRDRDDMPDGGRWVRDLRAREWSRGCG